MFTNIVCVFFSYLLNIELPTSTSQWHLQPFSCYLLWDKATVAVLSDRNIYGQQILVAHVTSVHLRLLLELAGKSTHWSLVSELKPLGLFSHLTHTHTF